eukprot:scaffold11575_cov179-Amphora_coffeaeformis.AAC.3
MYRCFHGLPNKINALLVARQRGSVASATTSPRTVSSRVRPMARRASHYPSLMSNGSYESFSIRLSFQHGKYRKSSLASGFATQSTPPPPPSPPEHDDKNGKDTKSSNYQTDSLSSSSSDPPIWTWVDRYIPKNWQPYARLARLDKPIGTWLLLWPCCWSTALAHPASVMDHATLVALFGLGAFTMRGAGCTINDLWDQDIDQSVERTRTRPLAAGDLTTTQAIQFLALQMATGCAVLVSLPHTWYCFQWGVASLPLVFLYPTTKRYFAYPQLVLGLCFNWGAWMGWAATYGSMDWATVTPLYLSGVTWTLVYDTLYAHQDKEDDAKLGLHSTALTFGRDEGVQRQILHGLAATTLLMWVMAGYQAEMPNPLLFGTGIAAAYGHLLWQIQTADLTNPHNLAERFRKNATTGALVYAALLAGNPPTMLW